MKFIVIVLGICIAILIATMFAGLLTMGWRFKFETFEWYNWTLFIVYYIMAICLGIICAVAEYES